MNCLILMCLLGAAVAVPLENGQVLNKNLYTTQTVQDRIPIVYELPRTRLVSGQILNQKPINQEVVYRVQYPTEQIYQTPEQVYSDKGGIINQLVGQNRYEAQPILRGGYGQNQAIYKYSGVEGLSTLNHGGVQSIYRQAPVESVVGQYQPTYKYEGLNQRFGVENQQIYRHEGGVEQPIYRYATDLGLNQYNTVGVQQQPIYRYTNEVEGLTRGVQVQPIYGYNREVGVTPVYNGGYVHNQPIYRGQTSNIYDVTGYKTGPIYEQGTGFYPTQKFVYGKINPETLKLGETSDVSVLRKSL